MSLVTSFSSMCMINTQSWSCVFTCDTSSVLQAVHFVLKSYRVVLSLSLVVIRVFLSMLQVFLLTSLFFLTNCLFFLSMKCSVLKCSVLCADSNLLCLSSQISVRQHCLEGFVICSVAVSVFLSAVLRQYFVQRSAVSSASPALFLIAIYLGCSDGDTPISYFFARFPLIEQVFSELVEVVSAQNSRVVSLARLTRNILSCGNIPSIFCSRYILGC